MPRLSAEEREEQLEMVQWLIEQRRVRSWTELAKILGVTRQAAQARFGKDGYGLVIPSYESENVDNRIYLGLSDELLARLRAATGGNGQHFIRQLLDQHLPPLTKVS